jgi:hypothetical protein
VNQSQFVVLAELIQDAFYFGVHHYSGDAPVSHAIIDALLNLDGRIHIQIFHDACKNIGHIPASIARQFLTKLALIIPIMA